MGFFTERLQAATAKATGSGLDVESLPARARAVWGRERSPDGEADVQWTKAWRACVNVQRVGTGTPEQRARLTQGSGGSEPPAPPTLCRPPIEGL